MAKKSGKPGKAQAIRAYQTNNPSAGPKEIAKALGADGYKLTAGYVSTIRSLDKKRKRRGKVRRGRPAGKPSSGGKDFVAVLLEAKKLASKLGGVEKAKAALDALVKLGV